MAINHDVGKEGEEAAVQYLINKGYEIVIRNYYADKAELDIVALKDGILVFVEVKTRSSLDFGSPQDFVTNKKIKLMIKAANFFIEEFEREEEGRFDIIAIHKVGNKFDIEHIEDVFYFF
ncbi:YraN family protein [Myroides marinus]|uniref:YraN family protein n=1 Tax=Myroides marinus TaxID=703342 RepID=UPI0025753A89|nr:YraN family protein [Myroides marinus]MDM1378855.1 YraN family protein [Myroides marinus]MDM1386126.1 YraN family protein [Myroides marinus]MDM1393339.1 YraN family protein [Myroides marinus]